MVKRKILTYSIVILVVFIVLFTMVFFMKGNYMKKTYEEIYAKA